MPASISYEPTPVSLARRARQVVVCRYDDAAEDGWFTILPHIAPLIVQYKEGPRPSVARFYYRFDDTAGDGRPLHFHEIMPLSAASDWIVKTDDRLVVLAFNDDGSYRPLFDGFAQVPECHVGENGQAVTFTAFGAPIREFDRPLAGAIHRSGATPTDPASDVETELPTRFNPFVDGRTVGNAVHDLTLSGTTPFKYPVFLDQETYTLDPLARPQAWTLAQVWRYLFYRGNKDKSLGKVWIDIPTFDSTDPLLTAWEPSGGAFFDPKDPDTYVKKDIIVSDVDISGENYLDAAYRLITPHDVSFDIRLTLDGDGKPVHKLHAWRRDVNVPLKSIGYQPYGEILDPGLTNVQDIDINRDTSDVAHRVVVKTDPVLYEASFVLAPGFSINPSDADAGNLINWTKVGENPPPDDYRLFVFAEDGYPHWNFETTDVETTATTLKYVLAEPDDVDAESKYVARPRPGLGTLLTTNADGSKVRAILSVGTDYGGVVPGVYNNSGKWQVVAKGGFQLLKDRLGIYLTIKDPNADFDIGADNSTGAPFPSGKVNVVECLVKQANPFPRFYFRLTCVIEADRGIEAIAEPRNVTPTKYPVTVEVDGKDKYRKHVIGRRSHLNDTGKDDVIRDDTALALAWARARQRTMEAAVMAGSVTIPRLTWAYQVGDRIGSISGRDMSLRTNVGGDQGEGPQYPVVVGIDYMLEGGQKTKLYLSDHRVAPKVGE